MLRCLVLFLFAYAPWSALWSQTPAENATIGITIERPSAGHVHNSLQPVLLPPSTRLAFHVRGEVHKFRYTAKAELLWHKQDTHYETQQHIRALLLGTRSQSSNGSITPYGLQPHTFHDKSRRERSAQFDFSAHEVTFSDGSPKAPITQGTQDRLSVFIQLGAMLAAAPGQYPTGTRIAITTVGARHADLWTFTVEGQETLQLPIGNTKAIKLQRLPRPGNDRDRGQKAELWLGQDIGWLPVRIRLTQADGDFVDLSLASHAAL